MKILKFICYFFISLFFIANVGDEFKARAVEKYNQHYIDIKHNGEVIDESLSFILTDGVETTTVTSQSGAINVRLKNSVPYTLSIVENSKYEFTTINVISEKQGFAPASITSGDIDLEEEGITVTKKQAVEKTTYSNFYIDVKYNEEYIEDGVKFILTDGVESSQVLTSSGSLKLRLKNNVPYTLSIVENDKYEFSNIDVVSKKDSSGFYHLYNGNLEIDWEGIVVASKKASTTKDNKKTISNLSIINSIDQSKVTENLTFIIFDETNKKIIEELTTVDSKLPILKLESEIDYSISLKENSSYTMTKMNFYVIKDGYPVKENFTDLIENIEVTPIINDDVPKHKILPLKIKDNDGNLISDELVFSIYNKDRGNIFIGDFIAVNGSLEGISLNEDEIYTLKLKDTSKYSMRDYNIYTFMSHYPIDSDDEDERYIEELFLTKKTSAPSGIDKKLELLIKSNGSLLNEVVTFEFLKNDNEKIIISSDDEGFLSTKLNVKNGDRFVISLKDSDKYIMETVTFIYRANVAGNLMPYINGELLNDLKQLNLILNKNNSDNSTNIGNNGSGNNKDTKTKKLPVILNDANGAKITKEISFELYEYESGDLVKTFTTVNGEIDFEIVPNEIYSISLVNDEYKLAEDYSVGWNNSSSFPIKFNNSGSGFTEFSKIVVVEKNKADRTLVSLPVIYKGNLVTEDITFELISDVETIRVTTENGRIIVNLLEEDVDYYIRVVGDKYETEFFPIVVKQKPTGKHPYNHLDCKLVQRIIVNLKDNYTKPIYKITDKNNLVSVSSEFFFSDLRMDVEKVDKINFSKLENKDVEIYGITFKNIYRNLPHGELVTLSSEKNYEVSINKRLGQKIKNLYYIDKNGELTSYNFSQTENAVTFITNNFSNFALEYNKDVEVSLEIDIPKKPVWIIKNPNGTTITGTNFAGLKLNVNKLHNNLSSLSFDLYDLYDIYFTDEKNNIVAMPKGNNYTVTIPKKSGHTVKDVYYVSDSGVLERVPIKSSSCETVTFITNHFSKYAVVYDISNSSSSTNASINNQEKPCDKNNISCNNVTNNTPCSSNKNNTGCNNTFSNTYDSPCSKHTGAVCNISDVNTPCSTNKCTTSVCNIGENSICQSGSICLNEKGACSINNCNESKDFSKDNNSGLKNANSDEKNSGSSLKSNNTNIKDNIQNKAKEESKLPGTSLDFKNNKTILFVIIIIFSLVSVLLYRKRK